MKLITYLVLVSIPFVTSLNFTLTFTDSDYQNRNIVMEGDAGAISPHVGIELTLNEAGRVKYSSPLHLWDSRSNELANFSTNFTFLIDSNMTTEFGYGLTFFLAQDNSTIGPQGAMGLPTTNSGSADRTRFVAVEFDTHWDSWDPYDSNNSSVGDHVGISVSSLESPSFQKWSSNVTGGGECQAWIKYDSGSKVLSVSFTDYQNNTVKRQDGLERKLNLRKELPEWVIFGFSAATEAQFQRFIIQSWSFESSVLSLIDDRVAGKKSKVGLVVGLPVTVSVLVVLLFALWRWKRGKRHEDEGEDVELEFAVEMDKDFEMGIGPKRFSYHELAQSTGAFDHKEKLGEGGFGGVYRGFLKESRTYVAVKRMSKGSKQGIKQYASEIRIISRLRHKNLVQLIGWCHENRELLLVYEYMENGSLDSHLFKMKSLLAWGTRYKIAHGLASALLYLHEEWEQCILHRDIKSSNVMLDSNFNAKLGDFGLAKLVDHDKGLQTTMLAGTLGYLAPECVVTGKPSKESDVFSFGVVALEIACGRKPIEYKAQESQTRLVEWVWELYESGTLLDAVDPRLGVDFEEEEVKKLMTIGLWCAHPDSKHRPSMKQVVQVLNSEASLPMLP
ncbi:hypothetical protein R6Q59_022727 [Mikania micrantha]